MKEELEAILEEFKMHGMKASYHYADDSGREWHLASREKSAALDLFDANPELQDKMREISHGFLWSLSLERKSA